MNLKLYIEIAQIAIIATMIGYIIPLDILLGLYPRAIFRIIITLFCAVIMWKYNATLHELIKKWKKK